MANKYSRYQLQPFPSLYVDNKHPEISQLLANRYDANKTSKDLIDRTLSQLDLMEGDKSHLERVKTNVKGMLQNHIQKQDWENSTLVVQDAATAVETDAGLIAANRSMQNRQAEIKAIREAKLNGIHMIDFGAEERKAHQSYFYDDENGTYVTNVYEPMSEKMLDYRNRKEDMIGKIPADQRANITRIGRGKTNKIANLVLEQYITDTHEGKQEYRYLMEVELPQTLPFEERARMAKASILKDLKEIAQQQEFEKVAAVKGSGSGSRSGLPAGVTISSSNAGEVNSPFNEMKDKIDAINVKQKVLLNQLNDDSISEENKELIRDQISNNNKVIDSHIQKIASKNGDEGEAAMLKYKRLKERYNEYGDDGQRLLAAVQYLTYKDASNDTDWNKVAQMTMAGGAGGFAGGATAGAMGGSVVLPGIGTVVGAGGLGTIGFGVGGVSGFVGETMRQWTDDMRNVRDWQRAQNWQLIGDSERDQLKENLFGDEDLEDMSAEHLNSLLGTNFQQSDIEELSKMTNAWYTFMIDDKVKDDDGNVVTRMSGDDLFEQAAKEKIVINQRRMSYDMTDEGNKKRNGTKNYLRSNVNWDNAGIAWDNFTPKSAELKQWLDDGGVENLQLEGVFLADIGTNTPMRLEFGFDKDGGKLNRTAYVTDPSVIQPGGWVWDLMEKSFSMPQEGYDEVIRQEYEAAGYENITVDKYTDDMAHKNVYYSTGSYTPEDVLEEKMRIQNSVIMSLLLNKSANFPEYQDANGNRGVQGDTGFIPFMHPNGGFNQAAWIVLSSKPEALADLRLDIMEMNMQDFSGLQISQQAQQ